METPQQLKENFINQLQKTESNIQKVSTELQKLQEYRIKLLGGLETLNILNPEVETESMESESMESEVLGSDE